MTRSVHPVRWRGVKRTKDTSSSQRDLPKMYEGGIAHFREVVSTDSIHEHIVGRVLSSTFVNGAIDT